MQNKMSRYTKQQNELVITREQQKEKPVPDMLQIILYAKRSTKVTKIIKYITLYFTTTERRKFKWAPPIINSAINIFNGDVNFVV